MSLNKDSYEEMFPPTANSSTTENQLAQMAEEINQLKNSMAQKDGEIQHLEVLLDNVCRVTASGNQLAQMTKEINQLKSSIAEKDEEIRHLKDLLDKVCRVTTSACSDLEQMIKTTQEGLSETLQPVKAVGTKAIGSERRPPIHEDMSRKIASKATRLARKFMRTKSRWRYQNEEIVVPTPTPAASGGSQA